MGGCWYLSCYRQRPRKDWASSSSSEVLKWHQHGNKYYLRYVKTPCKKMWMSHMLVCDYLLFSLCLISVFVHVLTCLCNAFLLSVCHCDKIGDKRVINEKGWTHYQALGLLSSGALRSGPIFLKHLHWTAPQRPSCSLLYRLWFAWPMIAIYHH